MMRFLLGTATLLIGGASLSYGIMGQLQYDGHTSGLLAILAIVFGLICFGLVLTVFRNPNSIMGQMVDKPVRPSRSPRSSDHSGSGNAGSYSATERDGPDPSS